ncbi:MAG: uncharacterized protein PWQ88_566 [Candidatus Methanomethylophilaceae archaeon]|nr:uncharacterized protein [Candidatus Methanomethylophilaceae archaeon]MDI3541599.1 uncharacterized protein [Candidatus Methanomethylophilaceae archaeon]HIJ00129.1 proteasome assembly chaperone family protein [Candidatus Methanomethylophilaceae archaeon]
MVEELTITEYAEASCKKAMLIVGFPSVGLVSSIATNFIVRTLGLNRIAGISSPDFPPYAMIQEGFPMPPVRIYGRDRHCDEEGEKCEHLLVVSAEFIPKMEMHYPMAKLILDWCQEHDVNSIVTMEGIAGVDTESSPIWGVASTDEMRKKMEKYDIMPMDEGMVRGISGIMLYEAAARGMNVLTLLGPARMDIPDARGAARLMEKLTKMIPELDIDPTPLVKEAEELEKRMKEAMETASISNDTLNLYR